MAIIATKGLKHGKCTCCGAGKYYTHRFQFFQDAGNKACITLCDACVNQMHTIMVKDMCDRLEKKEKTRKEVDNVHKLYKGSPERRTNAH